MPKEPSEAEKRIWPRLILRQNDQTVAAGCLVLCLLLIAAWCGRQASLGGRLIDIERAEPVWIDFRIDVNQANWQELALMPNIGEQLAKRIVADREEKGPYKDLGDLQRVRGIGPRTVELLQPYLLPLPPLQATTENSSGAQPPAPIN
jgi:competence protein ComEA